MRHIYMTRHDPDKNMHRFYQMWVTPGIFGDWSLIREWGRIGSPSTVWKIWYRTEADAIQFAEKLCAAKRKKGYQPITNT